MRTTVLKEQYKYINEISTNLNLIEWTETPTNLEKITKQVFQNKYSFRLTKFGFNCMSSYTKFIKIQLNTSEPKSKHIMILNFGMKKPFYSAKNILYTLDDDEAPIFLLSDGDLDLYYEMKKNEKSV